MDINFPDIPLATPDSSDYIPHPPYSPRETSFLFSDGFLSRLQNRLSNIAPLPSRTSINNFCESVNTNY